MSSGIGPYKNKFRMQLFEKQNGNCYYCNKLMSFNRKQRGTPSKDFATFEHLKRKSEGGKVNSLNIVLVHYKCNLRKNSIDQKKLV